jgi:hypothetical protein
MHSRLLELEILADFDQQAIRLLVRETEVDEMRDKSTQLIENKVLLVFKLYILRGGVLALRCLLLLV